MPHSRPSSSLPRREFLKFGGVAAVAGITAGPLPIMAGPFEQDASGHLIPIDKKLTPEWVNSLYDRGVPEVFAGDQLRHIGMPIGGIACGQLYLGGDGRLWRWDIFRPRYSSAYGSMSMGMHYANPPNPTSRQEQPLQHGFAVRVRAADKATVRSLSSDGFRNVRFRGEYPIGRVQFREPLLPLEVDLEAFSPFIPLDVRDSSLPCTLMNYTFRNTGTQPLEVDIAGWLENVICPDEKTPGRGLRRIEFQEDGFACSVVEPAREKGTDRRPPILFADFEGDTYLGWSVRGKAFGSHPFRKKELASFDQLQGFEGEGLVNTHETRMAEGDPQKADSYTGSLTSPEFTIERNYIVFRIGGGKQPGKACLQLLVDGKVVASETGRSDITMRQASFDVRQLLGKQAQLQIMDSAVGSWGHIAVDHITFEDTLPGGPEALEDLFGFGTLCLRLRGADEVRSAAVRAVSRRRPGFRDTRQTECGRQGN